MTRRMIITALRAAALALSAGKISVQENQSKMVVSGPYDLMKEVYPDLKRLKFKYDGMTKSWVGNKATWDEKTETAVREVLAPHLEKTVYTTRDEIARRRAENLWTRVPYDLKDVAKKHGGLWDPSTKTWYLPDVESVNLVRQEVDKYENREARKEAALERKFDLVTYQSTDYKAPPIREGRSFRHAKDGLVYTVEEVKSEFIPEDGLSFGLHDDRGWMHTLYCRRATESEEAEVVAEETATLRKLDAHKRRSEIAKTIKTTGDSPSPANPVIVDGDRVLMSGRWSLIYGGGDWFVLDGTRWIWFIMNNGADGDDWSVNNVRTGGAGAVGFKIPYDEVLAAEIRALDDLIGEK